MDRNGARGTRRNGGTPLLSSSAVRGDHWLRAYADGCSAFTAQLVDDEHICTLEGADGATITVAQREALRYPLKAAEGEEAWDCIYCPAGGWAVERCLCCVTCGQDAPIGEARVAELKAAKRAEMAKLRRRLAKRRITMKPKPLQQGQRSGGVYSADDVRPEDAVDFRTSSEHGKLRK